MLGCAIGLGVLNKYSVVFLSVGLVIGALFSPLRRQLFGRQGLVGGLIAAVRFGFRAFEHAYPRLLGWVLDHKLTFLTGPALLVLLGSTAWLGFDAVFGLCDAVMLNQVVL